jgi:peptidoglycan-N-acetylglucosamine deacetylase
MQAPSAVLEVWTSEFDTLYAEDRMMMIGMHPQLIGQPSRLKALEGLIEHALKRSNVWIGRCDEMVEDMRPTLQKAHVAAKQ